MHGNGFFGADGCCQLLIRCTAAAQGMAFDDLHPEHVSGATLQLRLEQKRKQVPQRWSVLEGVPEGGGFKDGGSFAPITRSRLTAPSTTAGC